MDGRFLKIFKILRVLLDLLFDEQIDERLT